MSSNQRRRERFGLIVREQELRTGRVSPIAIFDEAEQAYVFDIGEKVANAALADAIERLGGDPSGLRDATISDHENALWKLVEPLAKVTIQVHDLMLAAKDLSKQTVGMSDAVQRGLQDLIVRMHAIIDGKDT